MKVIAILHTRLGQQDTLRLLQDYGCSAPGIWLEGYAVKALAQASYSCRDPGNVTYAALRELRTIYPLLAPGPDRYLGFGDSDGVKVFSMSFGTLKTGRRLQQTLLRTFNRRRSHCARTKLHYLATATDTIASLAHTWSSPTISLLLEWRRSWNVSMPNPNTFYAETPQGWNSQSRLST